MRTGTGTQLWQSAYAHHKHSCSYTALDLLARAWLLSREAGLIRPSHSLRSQLNADVSTRGLLLCRWAFSPESYWLSALPSPFPYLRPSQLWARRTSLKKKRYGPLPLGPLPLLRDKRAMPTLRRGSWHFTTSHLAYLGVACVVYLKWAEWKVCQTAPLLSAVLN